MAAVDVSLLPVSQAIGELSQALEITDLTVAGVSIDEVILSLYRDFQI